MHGRCQQCGDDTLKFKDTERVFISAVYTADDEITPIAVPNKVVCQLRNLQDELVADLAVLVTDKAKGLFTLSSATPIATGKYRADVLFYDGTTDSNGNDMPTENNFTVLITRGISRRR